MCVRAKETCVNRAGEIEDGARRGRLKLRFGNSA